MLQGMSEYHMPNSLTLAAGPCHKIRCAAVGTSWVGIADCPGCSEGSSASLKGKKDFISIFLVILPIQQYYFLLLNSLCVVHFLKFLAALEKTIMCINLSGIKFRPGPGVSNGLNCYYHQIQTYKTLLLGHKHICKVILKYN